MRAARNKRLTPAFLVIGLYMVFSCGPMLWLVLSSLKGRQDLFAWPPKVWFSPDWNSYKAVFGLGSAEGTATAIGLTDALLDPEFFSAAGLTLHPLDGSATP